MPRLEVFCGTTKEGKTQSRSEKSRWSAGALEVRRSGGGHWREATAVEMRRTAGKSGPGKIGVVGTASSVAVVITVRDFLSCGGLSALLGFEGSSLPSSIFFGFYFSEREGERHVELRSCSDGIDMVSIFYWCLRWAQKQKRKIRMGYGFLCFFLV